MAPCIGEKRGGRGAWRANQRRGAIKGLRLLFFARLSQRPRPRRAVAPGAFPFFLLVGQALDPLPQSKNARERKKRGKRGGSEKDTGIAPLFTLLFCFEKKKRKGCQTIRRRFALVAAFGYPFSSLCTLLIARALSLFSLFVTDAMPREPNRSRPADSAPALVAARQQRRRAGADPRRFRLGAAPVRESDLRVGPLAARRAAFVASETHAPAAAADEDADGDPRDYDPRMRHRASDHADDDLLAQLCEAARDDESAAEPIDSDDDAETSAEAWRLARARRWRQPTRRPLAFALVVPFNRERV